MATLQNPNVSFKRGPSDRLPASAVDGQFYLTTDTNRLYVGYGTELRPVAETITVTSTLPTGAGRQGEFYYISGSNILCIYNNNQWVQINPDTNDNDSWRLIGATNTVTSSDGSINVQTEYTSKKYNKSGSEIANSAVTVTGSFTITKEQINSLVTDAEVIPTVTVTNSNLVIGTSGNGSGSDVATVQPGNGISFSSDTNGPKVNVTNNAFAIKSAAKSTNVTLAGPDGTNTSTVTFSAGTNLKVDGTTAGKITYSHGDVSTTETTSAQTLSYGGNFDVIESVTVGTNGHVTAKKATKYTLPGMPKLGTVTTTSNGGLSVTMADAAGTVTSTATLSEGLYYSVGSETVYNQSNLNDYFYTKDEADSLFSQAMRYKGTVSDADLSKIANPQVGDVWMTSEAKTYKGSDSVPIEGYPSGVAAGVGDLFIYTVKGTGNCWSYVPSANDTDTQYNFTLNSDKKIHFTKMNGSDVATVEFKSGNKITTSATTTGSSAVLTFDHNTATVTNNSAAATESTLGTTGQLFVTSVSNDNYGHISSVTYSKFKVEDFALSNNGNKIQLKNGSGTEKGSVTLSAGNLISVTNDTGVISIAHDTAGLLSSASATSTTVTINTQKEDSIVVPSIAVTDGHVTSIENKTYKIPARVTYASKNGIEFGTNQVTLKPRIADGAGTTLTNSANIDYTFTSSSLSIAKVGTTNNIAIDLVWGEF